MRLEKLKLTNFRCFGPDTQVVRFGDQMTALIGANGVGKTAIMLALLRMFGVTADQRRVRRQDFYVAADESEPASQRSFVLEAIFAFPELGNDDNSDGKDDALSSVPEFFHQMAATEDGELKCRLRFEATWTDDGSVDGVVDVKYRAIRTLDEKFEEDDCSDVTALDRGRVQMIYIPATRDGASQVGAFLRSRLWRAIKWSDHVRESLAKAGADLNSAFESETAIDLITQAVTARWQEVHSGGTDAQPIFRPVDLRFEEFIRGVEVAFRPDEEGRERGIEDLSDGQRSLFHIAMTAAALDVERKLADGHQGFQANAIDLPALTLVALEEPENNLSPFYLARIVQQLQSLAEGGRAQALISSHSASILGRIAPDDVRYLRLSSKTRTATVREIVLPKDDEAAAKFVREAVRIYPELYFARHVVLGEGASEEVVLPRLAEAMGLPIDRAFIAIVPLGGRHVNHLWRLLRGLEIPHTTLLDLDYGRAGGGWGRIKTVVSELLALGVPSSDLFAAESLANGEEEAVAELGKNDPKDKARIKKWLDNLEQHGVFFSAPLDLDLMMLSALPEAYRGLPKGRSGPKSDSGVLQAVLGPEGDPSLYPEQQWLENFKWYRYLFLGRGKPSTHVRVLSAVESNVLAEKAPERLKRLLRRVAGQPVTDQ